MTEQSAAGGVGGRGIRQTRAWDTAVQCVLSLLGVPAASPRARSTKVWRGHVGAPKTIQKNGRRLGPSRPRERLSRTSLVRAPPGAPFKKQCAPLGRAAHPPRLAGCAAVRKKCVLARTRAGAAPRARRRWLRRDGVSGRGAAAARMMGGSAGSFCNSQRGPGSARGKPLCWEKGGPSSSFRGGALRPFGGAASRSPKIAANVVSGGGVGEGTPLAPGEGGGRMHRGTVGKVGALGTRHQQGKTRAQKVPSSQTQPGPPRGARVGSAVRLGQPARRGRPQRHRQQDGQAGRVRRGCRTSAYDRAGGFMDGQWVWPKRDRCHNRPPRKERSFQARRPAARRRALRTARACTRTKRQRTNLPLAGGGSHAASSWGSRGKCSAFASHTRKHSGG